MHVKLIRHSERYDFKYPYLWIFCVGYYWADPPLTSCGKIMARNCALEFTKNFPNINYKYIISSPYTRTIETSNEFKKITNSEIIIEPLLSEYQPYIAHHITGYPDGIPTDYDDIQTSFSYPETYENYLTRVEFILKTLIDKYSKTNDNIIIVTH